MTGLLNLLDRLPLFQIALEPEADRIPDRFRARIPDYELDPTGDGVLCLPIITAARLWWWN